MLTADFSAQTQSSTGPSAQNPLWLPLALKRFPKLVIRTFQSPCDGPTFPTSSFPIYQSRYHHCLLDCPQTHQVYSHLRTFALAVPLAWNALSSDLITPGSFLCEEGQQDGLSSNVTSSERSSLSLQSKTASSHSPSCSFVICIIHYPIYLFMLSDPHQNVSSMKVRCLVYCCVHGTYNSAWHTVDISYIFMESMCLWSVPQFL